MNDIVGYSKVHMEAFENDFGGSDQYLAQLSRSTIYI